MAKPKPGGASSSSFKRTSRPPLPKLRQTTLRQTKECLGFGGSDSEGEAVVESFASPPPSEQASDTEPPPKQQKRWDDDVAKAEAALSTFHGQEAKYIYEAIDPEYGPFYVGRTGDMQRRASEHDAKCVGRVRALMKLRNYKFKDVVRRVPELPNGCHPVDVHRLESYFIMRRDTIYHDIRRPFGCNSRLGDGGNELAPEDAAEYDRMFADEGYSFPSCTHQDEEDVRANAEKEARAEAEMAKHMAEIAEQANDKESADVFNDCATLALNEMHEHMCKRMGLRAYVELVLSDYENKYVDSVDKKALQVQLNLIKEKTEHDAIYKDLLRIPRSLSLVCKPPPEDPETGRVLPDENGAPRPDIAVSSEAACLFLKGMLEMIASREEANLEWTHEWTKTAMYEIRAWSRANNLQKPTNHNTWIPKGRPKPDAAETSVGVKLTSWFSKHERADLKCCEVVMRGVPWFADFAHSAERSDAEWDEVCALVRKGYGLGKEPEFPGKLTFQARNCSPGAYRKFYNLLYMGTGKQSGVQKVFDTLAKLGRLDYYKNTYDAGGLFKIKKKAKQQQEGAQQDAAPEEQDDDE